MKDEIKKILDSLKGILDEPKGLDEMPNGNLYEYDRSYDLEQDEIKLLLDYITNLQQENERLETNCSELQNAIDNIAELVDVPKGMSVEDVYDKVKDYKSRCEKASEYINCNKQKTIGAYGDNEDDDFEICLWEEDINNLLNILQNGSDEE